MPLLSAWRYLDGHGSPWKVGGAQGRDRTADTAIFNRMLYQLSYLGMSGATGWSAGKAAS